MSGNQPVPSTYVEVAAILRDMAERVEAGDSFEGSIEYVMPWPDENMEPVSDAEVMVQASYRIGNSMGQGGLRLIGTMNVRDEQQPAD